MTDEQKRAIVAICDALLEGVRAGGEHGAPGGTLYSALMGRLSLQQFEGLMRGLERAGCVRKSGQLYYYVKPL